MNLDVIKHFFHTKWSGKWVTKPTVWSDAVTMRKDAQVTGSDHIIYKDITPQEFPKIDFAKKWENYKHSWQFTCLSETKQNVQDMVSEFKYLCRNEFYPAPWFPVWNSDEDNTVCLLEIDEGVGNPLDSTDNNYDFTLGGNPPIWKTDGGIHGKNYLRFEGDVGNDVMSNGTLLDVVPDDWTIEMTFKLVSGFYAGISAGQSYYFLRKVNTANDYLYFHFLQSTSKLVISYEVAGVAGTLTATGYIPEEKWTTIMVTHGARGIEYFLDGIYLTGDTSKTTTMADGTSSDFTIEAGILNDTVDWDLQRFRVLNHQALPYDSLVVTKATPIIKERSSLYKSEVTIVGELTNVFCGGQV